MSKALLEAAKKGNLEELNQLLQGPNSNVDACESGYTALHMAALKGHAPIVQALIAARADVNIVSKEGRTALYEAAQEGHVPIVHALIAAKANANAINAKGRTALHVAALKGHAPIIQALIAAKADLNVVDKQGSTVLHIAAFKGHASIVQALIAAQANANAAAPKGFTALHIVAQEGHAHLVQLIATKTNINATTVAGFTALYMAALYQIKKPNQALKTGTAIIEALLNAGAFIDTPMPDFPEENLILNILAPYKAATEQLFIAASNLKTTNENIDSILSKLGAGLNGRLQKSNNTALHVAVEKKLNLALELIAKGASVDVLGNYKLSVRDLLNQRHTQNSRPIIKLCLAYMKLHDLKKKVHSYTQEPNDTSPVKVGLAIHSAIAPKDSKSAMDNAPLFHSMSATAAAGTAVHATAAGSATASAGTSSTSFESMKSNSELELQLSEIYNLIMKDNSQSLEGDGIDFDLNDDPESADIEIYLESKKQSLYFELGAFILDHSALFPNALGIAESLLKNIKQKHPQFQRANARLVEMDMQAMKQPSAQNDTATIAKIKSLLYAGEASQHYHTVGDLMADVLGHGLDNLELREFKADHAGLMFALFNSLIKQSNLARTAMASEQKASSEKQDALAREQKALTEKQEAMNEIERLRLLLNPNEASSKTDADKAIEETNARSLMTPSGSKRKRPHDSSSTVSVSAVAALETSHHVPLGSASSTIATTVGTATSSPPSCKPEDSLSTKKPKV